jgi:hypothetical protein
MISYGHLTDFLKSDFLFHIHFLVIVNGKNIDFLALNLDNKFDLKRKSVDLTYSDFLKFDFLFHIHFSVVICDFLVISS